MPAAFNYNERELLLLTSNGDERAFSQLFELYADLLYGVALHYTRIPEIAEELVQDVFVKIWAKRANLNDIERFNDYIFIIARNHILNFLKKASREQKYKERYTRHFQAVTHTPEQSLLFKESEALIARAAAVLSPQQQQVYDLRRNQGLSLDEIAGQMGLSRNTVRNHLNRALQQMREYLQNHASGVVLLICMLQIFAEKIPAPTGTPSLFCCL